MDIYILKGPLQRRSGRQCLHACIHAVSLNVFTIPSYGVLRVDIFQMHVQINSESIDWRSCFPGYMHQSHFI